MTVVRREEIETAASLLKEGDILAVPTESSYGLVVRMDDTAAIKKLLAIKGASPRDSRIFTILLPRVKDIQEYALTDFEQENFLRHYFPGELTVILPKRRAFSHAYFNNHRTLNIRVPKFAYLQELLAQTGPLLMASTSTEAKAPCFSQHEVMQSYPKINVVNGECEGSLATTVLDWSDDEPLVIRQGGLLIVRY